MYNVTVQSVLYKTSFESIFRCLESLCNSASQSEINIEIAIGDASPQPLSDDAISKLEKLCLDSSHKFHYRFFNNNVGFSKGHNLLSSHSKGEYLLICNPDIIVAGNFFHEMLVPFSKEHNIGIVEARQIPLEHPKTFSIQTGDTNWASGACMLVTREDYLRIGGFDDETFWMYCEDVDFSWRIKELGKRIVYQPDAPIFHSKLLSEGGSWCPTNTEIHYSLLSALLLANKWQNKEALEALIKACENGDNDQKMALEAFRQRQKNTKLPKKEDLKKVSTFLSDFTYAPHKY